MSEKKNEICIDELDGVVGGVPEGDTRLVKCEGCGCEFDPDTTVQGPPDTIISNDGRTCYSYNTLLCPGCGEYHRYTVLRLKTGDRVLTL